MNSGTEMTPIDEDGDDAVVDGAAQHRGGDAERQRQRHREQRGDAGELQVLTSRPPISVGDRHAVGIGGAEVAVEQAAKPAQEAQDRRVVEMHGLAQAGDGLRVAAWPSRICAVSPGSMLVAKNTRSRRSEA